ncbi:MAG TPA: hypothetical protein VFH27_00080 [Longimicrobiaceae bacterium]|nr:hypothetical protein [Longimicrobiaceae bacterium]
MSLLEYQRALAELAARPDLCRGIRQGEAAALDAWDLTPRERARVEASVRHAGWAVNCTLYRANRLGPIYTLLPRSCFLLGDRFRDEAERFWTLHPRPDFMTRREIPRFAGYLQDRLREGAIDDPYLGEVLPYELASFELGLMPRRQLTEETPVHAWVAPGTPLRLHPVVRLLAFSHDPEPMLAALARFEAGPRDWARGEFYLLLDGRRESRQMARVDPALGRLLRQVAEHGKAPDEPRVAELLAAGYLVPALEPRAARAVAV